MASDAVQKQKLSLFALTAMVVGSMVGAGIFSLPRTFSGATGPFGAIIAWTIAGTGMYMLARVFQIWTQVCLFCLCESGVWRLSGLFISLWLLDWQLYRERFLLGADQIYTGRFFSHF